MPTDLTVILHDSPGELARLGEVMGAGGVNILGLAAFTGEGRGVIHLLVDDEVVSRAVEQLECAGMGWSRTSARCWSSTSPIGPAASASSRASSPRPT